MSAGTLIAVGQTWQHVRSGLLIHVEKVAPPYFFASYPGESHRGRRPPSLRRYLIEGFDRFHSEVGTDTRTSMRVNEPGLTAPRGDDAPTSSPGSRASWEQE